MRNSRILFVIALCMSLASCKSLLKKRLPVTDDSATPVASAAPPAVPPPVLPAPPPAPLPVASAAAEEEAPVPEDFEDEAFEKVTPTNFKAEFAKLSQEVAK